MADEILNIPINIQCISFLYSVAYGCVLILILSFFRAIKSIFSPPNYIVALIDIIYFLAPVLFAVFISIKFSSGMLRWYIFAGEILGFILFYFTVRDITCRLFEDAISIILQIISYLTAIIILPFKIILVPIVKATVVFKKNSKKIYTKCKLCLKSTIKSLYNSYVWIGMSKNGSEKEVGKVARRRKRKSGFLVKIITLSFVACAAVSFIHSQSEVASKRRELAALNESIELQQTENDEVRRILDGDNDLEYIERIAREKLGYAYPDEKIFIDRSGG